MLEHAKESGLLDTAGRTPRDSQRLRSVDTAYAGSSQPGALNPETHPYLGWFENAWPGEQHCSELWPCGSESLWGWASEVFSYAQAGSLGKRASS